MAVGTGDLRSASADGTNEKSRATSKFERFALSLFILYLIRMTQDWEQSGVVFSMLW